MQYAATPVGERIEAYAKGRAICPHCGEPVVAKCGEIRVHHWAHETGQDCDSWFEPETEWHRNWKTHFPTQCVEVPLGEHRADICLDGFVIELQNSSISPQEIQEREQFYGRRMVWVVNGAPFSERFFLMKAIKPGLFSFRWKHMKPTWRFACRPIILDFGDLTMSRLLGFKSKRFTDSVTMQGASEQIERTVIERADASEEIPTEIGRRSLFRINTLHENGWGSGVALDRGVVVREWSNQLKRK